MREGERVVVEDLTPWPPRREVVVEIVFGAGDEVQVRGEWQTLLVVVVIHAIGFSWWWWL